jgi:3-phosphoshikimate 1-carboxyvinyltransferase
MESMPDVAPTLMMIAPFLPGKTKITGLATLRIKECDRIAVPAHHLRRLGVEVIEGDDTIVIGELDPDALPPETAIETHDDHRMAMSFAVLGSKIGNLTILEPDCVNKTYPRFWEAFDQFYL